MGELFIRSFIHSSSFFFPFSFKENGMYKVHIYYANPPHYIYIKWKKKKKPPPLIPKPLTKNPPK